ncbi:MAG: alpha/beta fold hydrolase [Acidobacteriota bacterium]|jgi:3-oxoadipate enol-lactonase
MSESQTYLYHQSEGSGPPLILLNGIAMSAPAWEPVARPLAEHFRVIRCDFRGQLLTPVPPPESVNEHADDVVALLDHLGVESARVVGTSFGGIVGTLLAARYPDRVRALVTIASADGFDGAMADEVARWRAACVQSLEGLDRGHLADVLESVVFSPTWVAAHRAELAQRREQLAALPNSWFEGLIGLLDSVQSVRLRWELQGVRCPTLVVAAELDGFVPPDRARGLAEGIGGACFEILEGAGHAVVIERPRRLVERCVKYLNTVGV